MKKRWVSVLLLLLCALCLCTGCENAIKRDEAMTLSGEFFTAFVRGEYETAAGLWHPDAEVSADRLSSFARELEAEYGVDLSAGMMDTVYTGFSSYLHSNEYGGAGYELYGYTTVDGVEFRFEIITVRSEAGFGIYAFSMDSSEPPKNAPVGDIEEL